MSHGIGSRLAPLPATPEERSTDRKVMLLLLLGLFAFYVVIQYGVMQSWDGRYNASVAQNLWEHGRLGLRGDVFGAVPPQLRRAAYSKYGIGTSLVLAPMWQLNSHQGLHDARWLTLVHPLLCAVTAVVLYLIGTALGWRRRVAAVVAVVFGTLTMVPVYSTELFPDVGTMLCLALVLWGMVRWQQGAAGAPWIVGTATAAAILFRVESVVTIAPVLLLLPLFVPMPELRATVRRWLPALAVPLAAVGLWLAYYDNLRYGSAFDLGPDSSLLNFPFLHGVWRQVGSSGKGFFWYNPILIAALPGVVWLWRRHRGLALAVILLFVGRIAFFAQAINPDGDIAWGPRYLLPACALLALPLGETFHRIADADGLRRVLGVAATAVLAVASAVVVFAGLWVPYTYSWSVINNVPGYQAMPPGEPQRIVSERLGRQYNDWYWSPILLNLRVAGSYGSVPMHWWEDGPTGVGVAAAATAIAALTAAIVLAREPQKRRGPPRPEPSPPLAMAEL